MVQQVLWVRTIADIYDEMTGVETLDIRGATDRVVERNGLTIELQR